KASSSGNYIAKEALKNSFVQQSRFQCSYSSSIRLKKIEQISEGKVTFYIYEPIGCTPIN
ncbi:hypothetical protein SKM57_07100, partial [Acinetobacter faecalis]|uniref:hypothetical protein n=1 Tax=Acinetobacter faecalis TaxID=2665161 RepID=UPI002A9155BC